MEKVSYLGLPNCYRLSNGAVDVVVATDIGPRVLHYGLRGGDNVFGEVPGAVVTTSLGDWKPWGGHRVWAAPEVNPRSYAPDNDPVDFDFDGDASAKLVGRTEPQTQLRKEMKITLDPDGTGVTVRHRITNRGLWAVEFSVWALSIMNGEGGEAIIPQEPYRAWGNYVLPARPFVLWHYTDLTDARLTLGRRLIRLRPDPANEEQQKIGALDKPGWAAYSRGSTLFVKRFGYEEGASYPDYGCNVECFTAASFIELESLAPLRRVEPGAFAEHTERWSLHADFDAGATEDSLAEAIDAALAQPASTA
ncbi:MAG: DUF4380 domain-containing protein [Acidobacteriota bacterium]|nr:DUF4380 domain-containing protein [Acidobacteriota bacterium]